jgi:hypothetical protein
MQPQCRWFDFQAALKVWLVSKFCAINAMFMELEIKTKNPYTMLESTDASTCTSSKLSLFFSSLKKIKKRVLNAYQPPLLTGINACLISYPFILVSMG